jgi:hypothetical protein
MGPQRKVEMRGVELGSKLKCLIVNETLKYRNNGKIGRFFDSQVTSSIEKFLFALAAAG